MREDLKYGEKANPKTRLVPEDLTFNNSAGDSDENLEPNEKTR